MTCDCAGDFLGKILSNAAVQVRALLDDGSRLVCCDCDLNDHFDGDFDCDIDDLE